MGFGGVFGAIGSIAGSAISASASKQATQMQIDAIEKQQRFVFNQLNPNKINAAAAAADIERAKNQLALQGVTDPALLQARYAASDQLLNQIQGIGTGPGDVIGNLAAQEAAADTGKFDEVKNQMIDQALAELEAGATLPSDVQAELVKAGLERTGAVTGGATSRGLGGTVQRQVLGQAALDLKEKRQQQAMALTESAQNLDMARANILGNLFPALKQTQLGNLGATQGALASSSAEMPEAGLGGESIANIWLARVGATNELSSQAAQVAAQGKKDMAAAINQGIGGLTRLGASFIPKE
jgi:hypothetical protein